MKKLFLLDAYALIYRSYYAFIKNPRVNSRGFNTSAIYGFTLVLDEVLRKEKPTHIGVAFDPDHATFRHDMFPKYKAQRPPTPEPIKQGVPFVKKVIRGFNIPILEAEKFEADDVIGTLAKKAEKQGFEVYMMTPDKDFCQLLSDRVFLFKPKRSGNQAETWDFETVRKRYKIDTPEQFIDMLALWGDSSDNIPGVPGIGEKTSANLIKRFGSIEGIYENIHQIKGKQQQNLRENKEQLMLSRKLVTIVNDVPIEFDAQALKVKDIDREALREVFDELEFRQLVKRILQAPEHSSANPAQANLFGESQASETTVKKLDSLENTEHQYSLVDTDEKRAALSAQLNQCSAFCFDTETTGLDVHSAEIIGISFAFEKNKAFYLPLSGKRKTTKILAEFKAPFENPKILKIGQNIKFDMMMVQKYGLNVCGSLFDTMVAHYLLQPEQPHKLDALAEQFLDYKMLSIEELIGKKGKNQRNMRSVATDRLKEYAGEDADITLQLKHILAPRLKNYGMEKLFYEVEMPLIHVLASMETTGFKLDTSNLDDFAERLRIDILKIENKIHQLAGMQFNVASPKQLGQVLFDHLKIVSNPKRTSTKQYSTSEQELLKIQDKHEIVPKILEYRSLRKLLNTYVEALPELINPHTGRIHTSFNQAVTATGRLSSTNPNLQNIPVRTDRGREMRRAFVASNPDNLLIAADYSQIELRLMAHLSKDPNMIQAFKDRKDIHADTAARIFGVKPEEVTRQMRSKAKSANFGIIYGISSFGLAQNLNISRSEAKELIDSYFQNYPEVKKYMEKQIELARKQTYVQTLAGRRRYLSDIDSRNYTVRSAAERNAINAPIQGTAADIIKIAMNRCYLRLREQELKTRMILQVHDELIFDAPRKEIDKVTQIIRYEMENAFALDVPLTVEIGTATNWLKAH